MVLNKHTFDMNKSRTIGALDKTPRKHSIAMEDLMRATDFLKETEKNLEEAKQLENPQKRQISVDYYKNDIETANHRIKYLKKQLEEGE